MEKNYDTIAVEELIELISETLWCQDECYYEMRNSSNRETPSLRERQKIVNDFLHAVSLHGNEIRFDIENSTVETVPFFNYLVLEKNFYQIPDDDLPMDDWGFYGFWKLTGFDTFNDLKKHMLENDDVFPYSLFVKDGCCYTPVYYKFSFQNKRNETIYTNEYGLRYAYNLKREYMDIRPDCEKNLEIPGLCEFQCEKKTRCRILASFDDIMLDLEGEAATAFYEEEPFKENGTLTFEGTKYHYYISADEESADHRIFNQNGEMYCDLIQKFAKGNKPECSECSQRQTCLESDTLEEH